MNKRWKKITLFIFAPITIIIGFIIWLSWSGSTDHIESVADQFKPDSSWELARSHSTPPRNLCIDASCDRLSRTWITPRPVTQAEIIQILKDSGWSQVKPEEDCEAPDEAAGSDACWMRGSVDNYEINISLSTESPSLGKPIVSLFIRS